MKNKTFFIFRRVNRNLTTANLDKSIVLLIEALNFEKYLICFLRISLIYLNAIANWKMSVILVVKVKICCIKYMWIYLVILLATSYFIFLFRHKYYSFYHYLKTYLLYPTTSIYVLHIILNLTVLLSVGIRITTLGTVSTLRSRQCYTCQWFDMLRCTNLSYPRYRSLCLIS